MITRYASASEGLTRVPTPRLLPPAWWTYALAVAIPVVIALLTVSIQSIRAALVNPAETLRTE